MKWRRAHRDICDQLTPGLTCLSASCILPLPPTLTPVPGPAPPLAIPSTKPAVPRLARHPHPLLAPHRPVVRKRRAGGGAGALGWGIPAPSLALPRAHPSHRHAHQVLGWKAARKGGGRNEDQEVGKGTPREETPRAGREPEAGGCKKPEPKAGWRQLQGPRPLRQEGRWSQKPRRDGEHGGKGALRGWRLEPRRPTARGGTQAKGAESGRAGPGSLGWGSGGSLTHLHAWRDGATAAGAQG